MHAMSESGHRDSNVIFVRRKIADQDEWEYVFCCFFTTHAGVVILTFQGLTLMITTALHNLLAPNDDGSAVVQMEQYTLLYVYLSVMMFGHVMGIISAYYEKKGYAKFAGFLIAIGTLLYFFYTLLSFVPVVALREMVCIAGRCPDHHWLVDSKWRDTVYEHPRSKDPVLILVSLVYTLIILGLFIYSVVIYFAFAATLENHKR